MEKLQGKYRLLHQNAVLSLVFVSQKKKTRGNVAEE